MKQNEKKSSNMKNKRKTEKLKQVMKKKHEQKTWVVIASGWYEPLYTSIGRHDKSCQFTLIS